MMHGTRNISIAPYAAPSPHGCLPFRFRSARRAASRCRPASPRDAARLLVVRRRRVRTSPCPRSAGLSRAGDAMVVNDTKVHAGAAARTAGAARRPGGRRTADRSAASATPRSADLLHGAGAAGAQAAGGRSRQARLRSRPTSSRRGEAGEIAISLCDATAPRSTPPSRPKARCRCRPISRASARPTRATAPITRRCSPIAPARWPRPRRACISPTICWLGSPRAACRARHVTLHVGAGTFLPVTAEDTAAHRMHAEWAELDAQTAARISTPRARRAAASSLSARRRCARWKPPPMRTAVLRAVRRRHRHLHHAGLPLPQRRHAADQFPPAALDAVHAGLGLHGARHDAPRLCRGDCASAIASIPMAMPVF